jgi:hypothetical protein
MISLFRHTEVPATAVKHQMNTTTTPESAALKASLVSLFHSKPLANAITDKEALEMVGPSIVRALGQYRQERLLRDLADIPFDTHITSSENALLELGEAHRSWQKSASQLQELKRQQAEQAFQDSPNEPVLDGQILALQRWLDQASNLKKATAKAVTALRPAIHALRALERLRSGWEACCASLTGGAEAIWNLTEPTAEAAAKKALEIGHAFVARLQELAEGRLPVAQGPSRPIQTREQRSYMSLNFYID